MDGEKRKSGTEGEDGWKRRLWSRERQRFTAGVNERHLCLGRGEGQACMLSHQVRLRAPLPCFDFPDGPLYLLHGPSPVPVPANALAGCSHLTRCTPCGLFSIGGGEKLHVGAGGENCSGPTSTSDCTPKVPPRSTAVMKKQRLRGLKSSQPRVSISALTCLMYYLVRDLLMRTYIFLPVELMIFFPLNGLAALSPHRHRNRWTVDRAGLGWCLPLGSEGCWGRGWTSWPWRALATVGRGMGGRGGRGVYGRKKSGRSAVGSEWC